MSKKKRKKSSNTTPQIEDVVLIHTVHTIDKKGKQENKLSEKVKKAPQTFIEDTFQIGAENFDEPTVIKNEVKKKTKNMITSKELVELFTFKNKLTKIKTRVEHEKSFVFLFDFVGSTKLYRTYYINDIDDEYDLLLYHSVIGFKKKMAKLQLTFEQYQKFELYFESLKTLYGRFKIADNTEKPSLNDELNKMIDMSEEIAYNYFK